MKRYNYYDYTDAYGKTHRLHVGDCGADGRPVTQEMIDQLYGIRAEQDREENRYKYHTKVRFEAMDEWSDFKRPGECNRLLVDVEASMDDMLQKAIDQKDDEEMKAAVVRAFMKLKSEYQYLVINIKVQKRKNKDVAKELNLCESEISRKLKRALADLKKKYYESM